MSKQKIRTSLTRRRALKAGFRSGLEHKVSELLTDNKIKWEYECIKLKYSQKITNRKVRCNSCGGTDILVDRKYLPDFIIIKGRRILEVKGRFLMADRKKILSVLKSNPKEDLIMVFQNPNIKISKRSKKTYGSWCDENNIKWVGVKNLIKYLKSERALKQ